MKSVSIFNHVLGPVMRGPSSSHTAGGFHIACMARSMIGGTPSKATFAFDPEGSYARTYAQQGADRAFAMGLLGRSLTDDSFFAALEEAERAGLELRYEVRPLERPDHPNTVEIDLVGPGGEDLRIEARSIGGGEVELVRVNGWPTRFGGTSFEVLVETSKGQEGAAAEALRSDGATRGEPEVLRRDNAVALVARRTEPLELDAHRALSRLSSGTTVLESAPVYYLQTGEPLFTSAAEMVDAARSTRTSLGQIALEYEARLLGLSPDDVLREMLRRYDVMEDSVRRGLEPSLTGMQLLRPTAGAVFRAEAGGRLVARSMHTRAAARAMAVMHIDGAMGVVCAAPTGGSAGVIPGALVTIAEERGLSREEVGLALLACGAIGVIVAARSTFAAEVAGCQVEIGAAGAMASAAVVDAVGGSAEQAAHAAAISFQNTMGLVCDLVQGMVEIPCHTRNAVAAASAFVNADLILGGYANPIPLDETIDAVHAVGRAMPKELLCTSRGGLAVTPSALALRAGCCAGGCGDCRLGT